MWCGCGCGCVRECDEGGLKVCGQEGLGWAVCN